MFKGILKFWGEHPKSGRPHMRTVAETPATPVVK